MKKSESFRIKYHLSNSHDSILNMASVRLASYQGMKWSNMACVILFSFYAFCFIYILNNILRQS